MKERSCGRFTDKFCPGNRFKFVLHCGGNVVQGETKRKVSVRSVYLLWVLTFRKLYLFRIHIDLGTTPRQDCSLGAVCLG
jgi:hypothetical protein